MFSAARHQGVNPGMLGWGRRMPFMRRLSSTLSVAIAILAVRLTAGGQLTGQQSNLTVTDKNGQPQPGIEIGLFKGAKVMKLGATTETGKFPLNPTLLFGKPMIDLRIARCPNQQPAIDLFPEVPGGTPAFDQCPPGCSCHKKPAAFPFGQDYTLSMRIGPRPFFNWENPYMYSIPVAGGLGGYFALRGGSTSTGGGTGGGGTGGGGTGETRTFSDVVLHSFSGTESITSQTGNCNFAGAPVTITFTGSPTATLAGLVETSNGATFVYTGATTQGGTQNTFSYQGASMGTLPPSFAYSAALHMDFGLGTTATGTGTFNFIAGCTGNIGAAYSVSR
jgi:hypothetical protein